MSAGIGNTMSEQQSVEGRRFNKRVAGLFVFLSIIWLVLMHVDVPALWGVNLFHYLAPPLGLVFLSISVISIFPLLRSSTIGNKSRSKKQTRTEGSGLHNWGIPIIVAIGLGILFLEIQVAWPFLGDDTAYM